MSESLQSLYEKNIICACLNDFEYYNYCKSKGVDINYFFMSSYKNIWGLIEENALLKGISPLILVDSCKNITNEERFNKLNALEKLKASFFEESDFYHSVEMMKEFYNKTKLREVAFLIDQNLANDNTVGDIMNVLIDKIFNIEAGGSEIIAYNATEAVDATNQEIQNRLKGNVEDGVTSGIKTLDKEIKCFYYALYTIIVGRPGHGKTTLMVNCFLNNLRAGVNPVFFSLEMPASHLVIKMLGAMSRVPVNSIMNPKRLTEEELQRVYNALEELSTYEFHILDAIGMNVIELGMYLHKYVKKGCKIAYLDYIQLLKLANNKTPEDASEFRTISKSVRELIRKVNRFGDMALVLGAQAGRSVDNRPVEERIPTQRDLEWSSSIEQDAATIIGIMNREKYEGEQCEYKNQLFLGFPKHRYNNALKVNLAFLGAIQLIADLTYDERYNNTIENWKREVEADKQQREKSKEEQSKRIGVSEDNTSDNDTSDSNTSENSDTSESNQTKTEEPNPAPFSGVGIEVALVPVEINSNI